MSNAFLPPSNRVEGITKQDQIWVSSTFGRITENADCFSYRIDFTGDLKVMQKNAKYVLFAAFELSMN